MGGIKQNSAKITSCKKSEKRLKKEDYWRKLWGLTDEFHKAVLVDIDNVSSQQLSQIRIKLRSIKA
jgi:ribosomal protein L10